MVSTYGTKGTRRYCYYETRKDLARPYHPPATRYSRGQLEKQVIDNLADLLEDEHALRRLSGLEEAEQLCGMFAQARLFAAELQHRSRAHQATRLLVDSIRLHKDHIDVELNASALGIKGSRPLEIRVALPTRTPFRETKLRIDAAPSGTPSEPLTKLLADAFKAQRLVLAAPELSLNALGKREGRCRTQLGRLLRLSWLSPAIVEAITSGAHPKRITRTSLLNQDLPIDWSEQERLFGLST